MKRALLGFCILCLFSFGVFATVEKDDEVADREAVRKVCLDYFEGWFYGDAERFRNALHPDLMKRIPRKNESGEMYLHPSDRDKMADFVKTGRTKKTPEEAQIKVEVFEVGHGVATAKGSCSTFYDYLHLAKLDGEWKIVNVLWQTYPKDK